jgi:hypothetical protein
MNIQSGVKPECWVTWLACAISLLVISLMGVHVEAHPLGQSGYWASFLGLFGFPLLIISASAWPARRDGVVSTVLSVLAVVAGIVTVVFAFGEMNTTLYFLDARAQGRNPMFCGPPPLIFYIPLACVISVLGAFLGATSWAKELSQREKAFASHRYGWERTPLSALGLSLQGQRWAERNGITSVGQASRLMEEGIRVADGFTEEILREVREKLAGLGLEQEDTSSRQVR